MVLKTVPIISEYNRNNISVQFLEKIESQDKTVEELVEETKNSIAKNYY